MDVFTHCTAIAIGAAILLSGNAASQSASQGGSTDVPSGAHAELMTLVHGAGNRLASFTPKLRIERGTERSPWRDRHTPILVASSPWTPGREFFLEVPEYIWGSTASDRRPGPLYYGRSLKQALLHGLKDWVVRFPSLEKPAWRDLGARGLALDNPLEGNVTIRLRVIPHDRLLEVRVGVTNGRTEPITGVRTQLCAMSHREPVLADRYPTSSWLLSGGKLITWNAADQDLGWLEKHRVPGTDRFAQSCYLAAGVGSGPARGQLRGVHLRLGRHIDMPAIAKADKDRRRALVVYSPHGTGAFYNVLVPCFHADPVMGNVPPGTTRWTQSYYVFFEGDLATFMGDLGRVHERIVGRARGN